MNIWKEFYFGILLYFMLAIVILNIQTALLNFLSEYFIVSEYQNFKVFSLYIYVEYIFGIFDCTCFFIWNFCSKYLKRILHLNIG